MSEQTKGAQGVMDVPLCRGLVIRRAVRGSVEIAVVLGKASHVLGAVDVMIGWVDQPGVAGFATLRLDAFAGGVWRVATTEDAAIARRNLAVPNVDRHGVEWAHPESAVLTEALGPALTAPIVQTWNDEAQRMIEGRAK